MKFPDPVKCFKFAALAFVVQQSTELVGRVLINPQAQMGNAQDCKIWAKSGEKTLYSNAPLPDDVQSARQGHLKIVLLPDWKSVTQRCVAEINRNQSADLYRVYLQDRDLHNGKMYDAQINGVVQTYRDYQGKPIAADIPLGNKWAASDAIKAVREQDTRLQSREAAYKMQTASLENLGNQTGELAKKAGTYLLKLTFGGGS